MPRIRSIKPGFFRSDDVAVLPFRARLTWVGIWTICDDHGRTKDSTRLLKGDLWSLEDEVTLDDIAADLDVLAAHGRIVRYSVAGRGYLAVVNWHLHQAINRPGEPIHPAPPIATGPVDPGHPKYCRYCSGPEHLMLDSLKSSSGPTGTAETGDAAGQRPDGEDQNSSVSTHGALTPGRGRGIRSKEGERARSVSEQSAVDPGLGPEPPRRCPKHDQARNPGPCGACADARHEHEAWQRAVQARANVAASIPQAKCPEHPSQPAGRCRDCEAAATPAPESFRRNRKPREAS